MPGTLSLLRLDSINNDETRWLSDNLGNSFDFKASPDENDVEESIKECLPKMTPLPVPESEKDDLENNRISFSQKIFKESIDFSRSSYGKLLTQL